MVITPGGDYALNKTIAWAGCYAAADDVSEIAATKTPTTTPASRLGVATSSLEATSTTTMTTKQSNKATRADGFDMWVVIAAAIANSVL